jgi:hypothetical protein
VSWQYIILTPLFWMVATKFDPVCGDGEMIPVRHVRRISYD